MKKLKYQKKAVTKLLNYSCELLEEDGGLIIFQAPTGSGLTPRKCTIEN